MQAPPISLRLHSLGVGAGLAGAHGRDALSPQLKARCEELKLDWSTLSLENLLKEKQALKSQISEKQRHCLELQVGGLSRGLWAPAALGNAGALEPPPPGLLSSSAPGWAVRAPRWEACACVSG